MADITETSQWEAGIYQLELVDEVIGGVGGISNRPNVELGNRTARIKTVLDASGIYVVAGDHAFGGQNNDILAVFKAGVADGDAVKYVPGNNRYELCDPGDFLSGIADVTNDRVISGGMILHSNITGAVAGDQIYTSGAVAGGLSVTPSVIPVGRMLWKTGTNSGVIHLNVGGGGVVNHSGLVDDETEKHYLVGNILHSAINNDEPDIHISQNDLIGHISLFVTANSPPTDYLECDGSLVSKTTYSELYSGYPFSIGNRFGESGGSFYLPDFRGRVPRGYANGSSRDPDRLSRYADSGGITGDAPGSMQDDEFQSHHHHPASGYTNFMSSSNGGEVGTGGDAYGRFSQTASSGGNETRMNNFSAMYVIRYQ